MMVDLQSLFVALLVTAILQEFLIKPSVEVLKKYYAKSHKQLKKNIDKVLAGASKWDKK
jgi:hypothetical protein